MARKTALEKLHVDKQPKIIAALDKAMPWAPKGSSMVVSTPREVDALMAQVRKGKVTTIAEIRAALAARYDTDVACPISTGIFINIAAAAAEELRAQGRKRVTPWWRTLKSGGQLNPKFPGGELAQRKLLQAEGHAVSRAGRGHWSVDDYTRVVFDSFR